MSKLDVYILKALLHKETYDEYKDHLVGILSDKQSSLYKVFSILSAFYEETSLQQSEQNCAERFSLYFFTRHPFLKDSEKGFYTRIFEDVEKADVSPGDIKKLLDRFKEKEVATRIALNAVDVAEGRKSKEVLIEGLQALLLDVTSGEKETETPDIFVSSSLEALLDSQVGAGGINWRLTCLRQSLGPLRQGDFGFLFARPETGKTTFLASEVSHFLDQVDRPILWCNNEEQGGKVLLRCYEAAFGKSISEISKDRDRYSTMWRERGYDSKLRLYDSASIYRSDVVKLAEQLHPSCIIFDQIDKLKGFDNDRNDLELGEIYIWARELAKRFCPVIGVCQAGGSAENKQWLTMDDVVNAKTSKQAEADWILGIGATFEGGNIRFLNISKNKLVGGPEVLSEYRHGRFQVVIRPEIARYEDI